jgi:predicted nucleic acid-binding protein
MKIILVDTSIWIDHFRKNDICLGSLLRNEQVRMHPLILAELACGNLQHREKVLRHLSCLPQIPSATYSEALQFLHSNMLFGRGIGWVDVVLLASARLAGISIWSRDKRLNLAAHHVGVDVHRP